MAGPSGEVTFLHAHATPHPGLDMIMGDQQLPYIHFVMSTWGPYTLILGHLDYQSHTPLVTLSGYQPDAV